MPFHAATANMAALLRSARLLKCSPLGLLQITGTKRSGPPLSRLSSAVLGGRSSGGRSHLIRPAPENASSSCVWPHTVGCVRGYAVATEQKDENSIAMRSKQAQQFDWALSLLDNSVRKSGRITKSLLLRIFQDTCRTGYPSSNQALLLLRSCGSLLPEVPLEERTTLAHHMWDKLRELDVHYDVSHYNALLKVYLQNEFKFSPTDFLDKMEAANVQPNRVTYQRLIAGYCQSGNIDGASTILGFMKSKEFPVTEAVFSSLVTGHARAGYMESAKNVLSVMRGTGIQPGPDTYVALLTAYAENGDMESLKAALEEADSEDCTLMDTDLIQVMIALVKAGHQEQVPEIAERLRSKRGPLIDSMNMSLRLLTMGQEDMAFFILKCALSRPGYSNFEEPSSTFLRHCVNMRTSAEKIIGYCHELQDLKMHSSPLLFCLKCGLEAKNTDMSVELMREMKKQGLPIKPHFFGPLLSEPAKLKNKAGVMEIVKIMREFTTYHDADILSTFIIPVFNSYEEAQQALQDAGAPIEVPILSAKVRVLASTNLASFYSLLSEPSFPPMQFILFRNNLVQGFKKFNDLESMVKITELLYRDVRFSKNNAGDSLLYSVIESMPAVSVQEKKELLQKYFNDLHSQNIRITLNVFRGIKKLLDAHEVPELNKDVFTLVDPQELTQGNEINMEWIEKKLAKLKAEDKPVKFFLRQSIQNLTNAEDLPNALDLKQRLGEDVTAGVYMNLIGLCCKTDNVDEALKLKKELTQLDPSFPLSAQKSISMVTLFLRNGKVEEALDILKEMKEKDVVMNDMNVFYLCRTLNTLATKGDPPVIQRLLDTIFTLGLTKPTIHLCTPLVSVHRHSGDLPGAIEAMMQCHKNYNVLPTLHQILVTLVEQGDTEQLQKVMDFVCYARGEMQMLYDMFFAFLKTGRYREARKVIETPGMRAKPARLQWFAEKCLASKDMETLEQMVNLTAKLYECDRDEMYNYILRLCKMENDWKNAEAVWVKMQEENVIPSERTLRMLAEILKANGKEVPFEVPEIWYEQAANEELVSEELVSEELVSKELVSEELVSEEPVKKKPVKKEPVKKEPVSEELVSEELVSEELVKTEPIKKEPDSTEQVSKEQATTKQKKSRKVPEDETHLQVLCKKGKAKEAYKLLKTANSDNVVFPTRIYNNLIRSLLAKGELEDAMAVKDMAVSHKPNFHLDSTATSMCIITHTKKGQLEEALEYLRGMIQADLVPLPMSVSKLAQALGKQGNIEGIQEVASLVNTLGTSFRVSRMVFTNNMALAHINNGDINSAVEVLESVFMSPESSDFSMSYVFRKLMDDNKEEALDKLSAMAERLVKHFACNKPALDLFFELLDKGKTEDAKFMLARCNVLAEEKRSHISYMSRKAKIPGQVDKIKTLQSLIPDLNESGVVYTYLIKCHTLDNDFASAKALYEQAQKEGVEIDELSLKRLAQLYQTAGEEVPFTEPPLSFKHYAEKLKEKSVDSETTEQ